MSNISIFKCLHLAERFRTRMRLVGAKTAAMLEDGTMTPLLHVTLALDLHISCPDHMKEIIGREMTPDELEYFAASIDNYIDPEDLELECSSFAIAHSLFHAFNRVHPTHKEHGTVN